MFNKLQNEVSLIGIIISVIIVAVAFCIVDLDEEEAAVDESVYEVKEDTENNYVPVMSGWINENKVDAMESPSKSSKVVDTLFFNDRVLYTKYDEEWYKVIIGNKNMYVSASSISKNELPCTYYKVPSNTGFKSFMDYTTITMPESEQYIIQSSYAETGNYGIRIVYNRYCIALGSYFTDNVGQYVDLILENGTVIPCVLAEQKADIDTDYTNTYTVANGCLSEFIVDINSLNKDVLKHGDISYCREEWNSPVVSIRVYEKNIFE